VKLTKKKVKWLIKMKKEKSVIASLKISVGRANQIERAQRYRKHTDNRRESGKASGSSLI